MTTHGTHLPLPENQKRFRHRFWSTAGSCLLVVASCCAWTSEASATSGPGVESLNVVRVLDDPFRSRVYGTHQPADGGPGALIIFDPATENYHEPITLGLRPSGMAITTDGDELLVISGGSAEIHIIDLGNLTVSEVLSLPSFATRNHRDVGNIAAGANNQIFYTDGNAVLHRLSRDSGEVLQTVGTIAPGDSRGIGQFALSHDRTRLYTYSAARWTSPDPNQGTLISKFQIDVQNQLEYVASNKNRPMEIFGIRPDAPVFVSRDDTIVMAPRFAFDASDLEAVINRFPSPVRSITPAADIAATESYLYFVDSGLPFFRLPDSYAVQTITSDSSWLVYFDPASEGLRTLNISHEALPEGPSATLYPPDNGIVPSPPTLTWPAIPEAQSYRIYLSHSAEDTALAEPGDAAFLGESQTPEFELETILSPHETYFWRVEGVTGQGTKTTAVRSFSASPVGVSPVSISRRTLEIDSNQIVTINLFSHPVSSSTSIGQSVPADEIAYQWHAHSDADWIRFPAATGVVPEPLLVNLDTTLLEPGVHHGEIEVSIDHDFTLLVPVRLEVEPVNITIMQSDRFSSRVYALSDTPDTRNAYLVEIDAQEERVTRVRNAGRVVSDFALHPHEGRIYVMNFQDGHLLYFDQDSMELTSVLSFARSGIRGDMRRIAATSEGRLVVQEADRWNQHLIDTATGASLDAFGVHHGWSVSDPTGRYLYFRTTGTSNASLSKFDLFGDRAVQLASISTSSISPPRLLISEDGSRLFTGSQVVSSDLAVQWANAPRAYATTSDGSLLVGGSFIYDVPTQTTLWGMPAGVAGSAYNSTANRLVTAENGGFGFYELTDEAALTAPELSVASVTHNSVALEWIDNSLETGFILQRSDPDSDSWRNVFITPNQDTLNRNTTSHQITSLNAESTYSFRIKAFTPMTEGPWSNVVTATTEPLPFTPAEIFSLEPLGTREILIRIATAFPHPEDILIVERRPAGSQEWQEIIRLFSPQHSYVDEDVEPASEYSYRVQRVRGESSTEYSAERSITAVNLTQPSTPQMVITYPNDSTSLMVHWSPDPLGRAENYRLQYRPQGALEWETAATTDADQTSFLHTGLTPDHIYQYRVRAFNQNATSHYSSPLAGIPRSVVNLIHDDFEEGTNPRIWRDVQNGQSVDGGPGFDTGAALWFIPEAGRAETYPVDLRNGGYLTFSIRGGNAPVDGPEYWASSHLDQRYVYVEYSLDAQTWQTMRFLRLDYPDFRRWENIALELPAGAHSATTRFRWRMVPSFTTGNWAIDNVRVISEFVPDPPAPETLQTHALNASTVLLTWPLPQPEGLGSLNPANNPYRFLIERRHDDKDWTVLTTVGAQPSPDFIDELAPSQATLRYRVTTLTPWTESAPTLGPEVTTLSQLLEWRLANHGTAENSGDAADLNEDAFGVTNLIRYAFGLDIGEFPGVVGADDDTPGLPVTWYDPETARLNVAFLRRSPETNPEITYHVEFSQDLSEWISQKQTAEIRQSFGNWEYVRYEAPNLEGESPNRFARVRVSRPSWIDDAPAQPE